MRLLTIIVICLVACSGIRSAFAYEDISGELAVLEAEYVRGIVTEHKRREGLALIWTFSSPHGADGRGIEQQYRDAARQICLKNGRYRFNELRKTEQYRDLRYFVVELETKTSMLIGSFFRRTGLEFEPDEECKEF